VSQEGDGIQQDLGPLGAQSHTAHEQEDSDVKEQIPHRLTVLAIPLLIAVAERDMAPPIVPRGILATP
jgi:hypothetical protein